MPFREKLKSLIHRHDDETTPPSSPRQSRYEVAPQEASPQASPRQGQRPVSGSGTASVENCDGIETKTADLMTDQPSQPSSARSRSKLRRSFDRKSAPAADDSPRKSLDGSKRKSLDQRQINAGVAPSVPEVPSTYKDGATARPAVSQDAQTRAAKESARRSSNVINFNHNNAAAQPLSTKSDRYSEDVADWNIMNAEKPSPTHAPAPLNVTKSSVDKSRQSSTSSYSSVPERTQSGVSRKPVGSDNVRGSRDLNVDGRRQSVSSAKQRSRVSMDKPLPAPPHQPALSEDPAFGQFLPRDHNYLVKDAPAAPVLEGVVNLKDTVDTDVTETWAPGKTTLERNMTALTDAIQLSFTRSCSRRSTTFVKR